MKPSRKTHDYLERAASCERLADSAVDPANREVMLYLAKRWRSLAARQEAKTGSADVPSRPQPSPER